MTREEKLKIVEIAKRAENNGLLLTDRLSLIMDIEAAHKEIGLKLDEFFSADEFDFAHDIQGIQQNIDRNTKKMQNCFLPRFAKSE